jgi:hypothetical protein
LRATEERNFVDPAGRPSLLAKGDPPDAPLGLRSRVLVWIRLVLTPPEFEALSILLDVPNPLAAPRRAAVRAPKRRQPLRPFG